MKESCFFELRRTARFFLISFCLSIMGFLSLGAEAAPPSGNYRLIHADEFSGESVDYLKWGTQYQWGRTHNHEAYMRDENVTVDDGILTLTGVREDYSGKGFTSGVISSHSKFRYTEGYAEMRIKMPSRRGSWPAFWMLDNGWPPEIDIMEYPLFTGNSLTDEYAVNSFWGSGSDPPSDFSWIDTNTNLGNDYHTFGLEWTSTQLRYYFNGNVVKTASDRDSFNNMYLIFNYAIGGWPGSPSQTQWPDGATDAVHADWVRIWQNVGGQPDSQWTYNDSDSGTWKTDGNWTEDTPKYERQSALFGTLSGRSTMEVTWEDSVMVGDVFINSDTVYTFGQSEGNVANIMFSDRGDGWSRLWVESGVGGHVINNRIDAWSGLSILNDATAALTINGDIIGQVRHNDDGTSEGGAVTFRGFSTIVVNGNGTFQNKAELRDDVTVQLNGGIFQEDTVVAEALLELFGGTLQLATINAPDEGGLSSLGYLPTESQRIEFDGGTLKVTGDSTTQRGFTILSGGGTIEAADPRTTLVFNPDRPGASDIVSNSGGDLELGGVGNGVFNKILYGNGGLRKTGSSIWSIGGINVYSGETSLEAGRTILNGTTGYGPTTVAAGAILEGNGDVRSDLTAFGTVAPGLSTGQIDVGLTATFESGSRLEIEIADTSDFDMLVVGDDISILTGSELAISLLSSSGYVPMAGDLFEFLTSGSNLVGEFTDLSLPMLEDLNWLINYSATSVAAELVYAADFDFDGDVDGADFLVWQRNAGISGDVTQADGDANGDGQIDGQDLGIWSDLLGSEVDQAVAATSADFDADGDVDGDDYLIWQENVGTTTGASFSEGDSNGDGVVDSFDLEVWRQMYGDVGTNTAISTIPEPRSTMLLICLFAIGLVFGRVRLQKQFASLLLLGLLFGSFGTAHAWDIYGRWTNTLTDGGGHSRGDPLTLLWSIVPDGEGWPRGSNSNLIEFLDIGWNVSAANQTPDLTNRSWWSWMDRVYEQFERTSGLTMTYAPEQNSDGTDSGLWGDLRVGGVPFTWENDEGGVLADNTYPNGGDMRVDTYIGGDGVPGWSFTNSSAFRNLISHETGHGVGLGHSDISGANAVMETPLETGFWALQFDDVYGLNRMYGDPFEKNGGNDTSGTAYDFGRMDIGYSATIGTHATNSTVNELDDDWIGIDGDTDEDWFSFTVVDPIEVSVSVEPIGPSYTTDEQGSVDATSMSNLSFQLIGTDGTTVLETVDGGAIGETEELQFFTLASSGRYYIRVYGDEDWNQFYQIDISADSAEPNDLTWFGRDSNIWEPVGEANFSGSSGLTFFNNYDNVTFNDGGLIKTVSIPSDILAGEIVVDAASNYTFTGAGGIIGGTITINGTGALELANNNNGYGETNVNSGTLIVTTETGSGVTTVAQGAMITGGGTVRGDLENSGLIQPGTAIGTLTVLGDLSLEPVSLIEVELGLSSNDLLDVAGIVNLNGELKVTLLEGLIPSLGMTFDILDFGSAFGAFDTYDLPVLADGLSWDTSQLTVTGELSVFLPGDFDQDNDVDGDDFLAWIRGQGLTAGATIADGDADLDGDVDANDLGIWRDNFGQVITVVSATAAVPEPSSLLLIGLGSLFALGSSRRQR